MTHNRVVAVVISIWVLSVFVSFLMFWVPLDIFSLIISFIGITGVIVTTMAYVRIYLAVRRHQNQLNPDWSIQISHAPAVCKEVLSTKVMSFVTISSTSPPPPPPLPANLPKIRHSSQYSLVGFSRHPT